MCKSCRIFGWKGVFANRDCHGHVRRDSNCESILAWIWEISAIKYHGDVLYGGSHVMWISTPRVHLLPNLCFVVWHWQKRNMNRLYLYQTHHMWYVCFIPCAVVYVQGSTKSWAWGCMILPSWLPLATGREFTQPRAQLLREPRRKVYHYLRKDFMANMTSSHHRCEHFAPGPLHYNYYIAYNFSSLNKDWHKCTFPSPVAVHN